MVVGVNTKGKEKHVTTESAQKKSSVFGFLKDLVAEEVPDKPMGKSEKVSQPPEPLAGKEGYFQGSTPPPGQAVGPDPQALAKLEQRLQSACPPAYSSFMEQYTALADVIPDETTRFKAALKTSHTKPEQVLAALDQLISTMEGAHTDFTTKFEENKAKKLGEAQQSLAQTDELIKSSEEQIKAIQDKIGSLRTKRETDAQGMAAEAARLETIRGGFEAAHSQVVGRLSAQKSRIAAMPKV